MLMMLSLEQSFFITQLSKQKEVDVLFGQQDLLMFTDLKKIKD